MTANKALRDGRMAFPAPLSAEQRHVDIFCPEFYPSRPISAEIHLRPSAKCDSHTAEFHETDARWENFCRRL
jgi:hypothetical protein